MHVVETILALYNRLSRINASARGMADIDTKSDAFVEFLYGLPDIIGRREVFVLRAVIMDRQLDVEFLDHLVEDGFGTVFRGADHRRRAHVPGKLKGPVVLGRDHHDVSGTDSPYRETANIYDGSRFTADMAVHNFVGDSFRGATWVSLHNGGGVGWGEVINGGFGMVLDGSSASRRRPMARNWRSGRLGRR